MNRRKFMFSLSMLTGGAIVSYYAYKCVRIHQQPNLLELKRHSNLISELAEIIIPRTDTPGAKDVHVEKYIMHIIEHNIDVSTSNNFIEGLNDVVNYSLKNYEKEFSFLSKNEKSEILKYFKASGQSFSGFLGKIEHKIYGKSFYEALHEYTCIAFCTSQEGATQALSYKAIPSKYVAVNKLSSDQKSWATK